MKNFDKFCETFDVQDLEQIVYDVYGYNGALEEYYYHEFDDEFFITYFAHNPIEAARATHFGDVNWSDGKIRFNSYGNLETISDWMYKDLLIDNRSEIIEEAINLYENSGEVFNDDINERIADYLNE